MSDTRRDVIEVLCRHDRFLIVGHIDPDGDSIGASLGLMLVLREAGQHATVALARDQVPQHYQFLPGLDEVVGYDDALMEDAVLVALDAADARRLPVDADILDRAPVVVNIDHHLGNDHFGTVNLVEEGVSSVSEIVYGILTEAGFRISSEAALCFYVGIMTDTGRFSYPNAGPDTHRVAAELLNLGVDPWFAYRSVYERRSIPGLHLLARVLDRAQAVDGLVWSVLYVKDFKETEATPQETENFVDLLRETYEARVAMLIREQAETSRGRFRVSLRSKGDVNVQTVAQQFGGGGHEGAAGFSTEFDIGETVASVRKLMDEAR